MLLLHGDYMKIGVKHYPSTLSPHLSKEVWYATNCSTRCSVTSKKRKKTKASEWFCGALYTDDAREKSKLKWEFCSYTLISLFVQNTFEGIDEAFQPLRFNRLQQPEEYWCRESILNYLNLFINSDTIAPFNTEQDLLEDVYGFIKASKRLNSTIAET